MSLLVGHGFETSTVPNFKFPNYDSACEHSYWLIKTSCLRDLIQKKLCLGLQWLRSVNGGGGGGGMSSGLFINDTQIVSYFTENELSFNTECLYVIFLLSCLQLAYYYHFFVCYASQFCRVPIAIHYHLPVWASKSWIHALKTLPLEEKIIALVKKMFWCTKHTCT